MLGFSWRRRAESVPAHNPHYEQHLDVLLTPVKDRWRGLRVGQTIMGLLESEMSELDFESYYLRGALTAATGVLAFGRGLYQTMPMHQAAEAHQRTVDVLKTRLDKSFSSADDNPHAQLRWAAAYVALTGQEHWHEADAEALKTDIAPLIRRGIEAGDDKSSMIVAALAPRFRVVFNEELWRTAEEGERATGTAYQALNERVEANLHRPAGLSGGSGSAPYGSLIAAIRVMEAVELQRTPDDPGRGIHIIDPPPAARW